MNKKLIAKIVSFLGVLCFEAWFFHKPSIAVGITFIISLISYLALEFVFPKKIFEEDKELFKNFSNDSPNDGFIEFLRNHDFGGSFQESRIDGFFKFCHDWDSPHKRFINKTIQKKMNSYLTICKDMSKLLALYTSPTRVGLQGVIPSREINHDSPLMDKYNKEIKELNEKANELIKKYDKFIIETKRKLS